MLQKEELVNVVGGAITATLINALARAVTTILDLGRTLGSSIRRSRTKNYC